MKSGGAHAVKLEGGAHYADRIRAIVDAGIPVMAHLGFTPQSEHALGGYRVQGRGEDAADKMLADARAVTEAGAFAVVLEMVPAHVAKRVTAEVPIPTVGIGAGSECDAQVLVWTDMVGPVRPRAPHAEVRQALRGHGLGARRRRGLLRPRGARGRLPGPRAQLRLRWPPPHVSDSGSSGAPGSLTWRQPSRSGAPRRPGPRAAGSARRPAGRSARRSASRRPACAWSPRAPSWRGRRRRPASSAS